MRGQTSRALRASDAGHVPAVAGMRPGARHDRADDHEGGGEHDHRRARVRGTFADVQIRAPPRHLARCQVRVAVASSPIASTKWNATTQGLSPTSTVIPPATALTTTSQNHRPGEAGEHPESHGFCNRAATIAQPTATISSTVTNRFPNSIDPWMPSSRMGAIDEPSQVGQVGQPRPGR